MKEYIYQTPDYDAANQYIIDAEEIAARITRERSLEAEQDAARMMRAAIEAAREDHLSIWPPDVLEFLKTELAEKLGAEYRTYLGIAKSI